jgi:hypothetical protein
MKPTFLLVPLALACALPAAAQQPQRAEACTDTITGNSVMTPAQLRAAELQGWPEPGARATYRLQMLQERLSAHLRDTGKVPQRLFDFADSVAEVPWLSTCDPWGHRVVFVPRAGEYDLRSAGPDGILGTADDIVRSDMLRAPGARAAAPPAP